MADFTPEPWRIIEGIINHLHIAGKSGNIAILHTVNKEGEDD